MIKLHVSACKKITDGNYGSRGGSVGIEVEVDSSLVGDSAKLQAQIRHLFELARRSLTEELQANNEHVCVVDSHQKPDGATLNGNGAGHSVSVVPVRYASEKQLALIQGLIRKSKIPYQPLLGECKVGSFNELTVQQASRMIESLKAGGVN